MGGQVGELVWEGGECPSRRGSAKEVPDNPLREGLCFLLVLCGTPLCPFVGSFWGAGRLLGLGALLSRGCEMRALVQL